LKNLTQTNLVVSFNSKLITILLISSWSSTSRLLSCD